MANHVYLLIVLFVKIYSYEPVVCLHTTLVVDKLPIVRIRLSEPSLSKVIEGNNIMYFLNKSFIHKIFIYT